MRTTTPRVDRNFLMLAVSAAVCGCGTYEDSPGTPKELESIRATTLANGDRGLCLGLTDGTVKCMNTVTKELSGVLAPMGASFVQGSVYFGTSFDILRADGTVLSAEGELWSQKGLVAAARIYSGLIYVTGDGRLVCSTDTSGVTDVAFDLEGASAKQIAFTDHEVCAILSDSTVRCWPYALETPKGSFRDTCVPGKGVTVPGLAGVSQLAMAVTYDVGVPDPIARTTRCALSGEQVFCWGYNGLGMTGSGLTGKQVPSPAPVQGVTAAIQVDVTGAHACALTKDGSVYCWGPDPVKGRTQLRKMPMSHMKQISLGFGTQAGLRSDGVVVLWGGTHSIGLNWFPINPG
jgi:hypothetical protein